MPTRLQHPFSKRAWLVAILAGLLCGLLSLGQPIDLTLKLLQFKLYSHHASGEIVIVGIDEKTLEAHPEGKFNRRDAAAAITAIRKAGADRLFVDFVYDRPANEANTKALESAIADWGGKITLAVMGDFDNSSKKLSFVQSRLSSVPEAQKRSIHWNTQFLGVWNLPLAETLSGETFKTFSAEMADIDNTIEDEYWPDYSFDLNTVPNYGVLDVMEGNIPREALAGKTVIYAPTAPSLMDMHYMPGRSGVRVPGAYFHVIGAETLRNGIPLNVGWLFIWAAIVGVLTWMRRASPSISRARSSFIYFLPIATLIIPVVVPAILAEIWVGPSVLTSTIIAVAAARRQRQRRAQRQHHESGLPNFEALRDIDLAHDATIVAAKLVNFDTLSVYLPQDGAKQLENEVIRRLRVATTDKTLYHDENGFFAWVVELEGAQELEEQLAGLAALFIPPVKIGEERIDVQLAFGIEENASGSTGQKLAAAMVAASQSQKTRKSWSAYRPPLDEEARWQHSFQSQLNQALLNGEIWVAYQPQLDVATNRIVGAEALARWTHPRLGNVNPEEFILQAEKHQRIERLTLFVLNDAIGRIALMHQTNPDFSISVNMSALLLHRDDLVGQIKALLTTHGVPARCLTIEITETAEIEDHEAVSRTLAALKAMGCRLSIDDYGTGQSNLDYLTKFEADEIKIDKRFVTNITDSNRNLEVVTSTIEMAHRLGATTVAEGVEGLPTFDLLSQLGCDVIQGYLIGKPMIFENLASLATGESTVKRLGSN